MSLLFTDLYELTMAQGYWVHGRAEEEAVFHLAYRDAPPEAACVLACGLEPLLRWLEDFAPTADDLSYLASLTAPDGTRLFQAGFLDALASLQFTADVDAVPEGTAVFPGGPLLRVQGPLMQAQMIETAALNQLGYASLVMTQAAQVCAAAQGDPVLEFGLRRAQGPDGGHTASRAAYLGGCTATSNLVAAQRWNIPVRGTHAHSWVMSFDDEQDAFAAYLASAPNNSILLVDTYDVATGLDRAIAAGQQLTARGGEFSGVRLDSGDLGHWARVARQKLDAAGFAATRIVASGGINAREVRSLKRDGAPIDIWGVGTWLVTGGETAALDTLPGSKTVYLTWQSLDAALAETLSGAAKVAMNYSPGNEVPYVSRVDAGTVEAVRAKGVEVLVYEPTLTEPSFFGSEVVASLGDFKARAGLVAERSSEIRSGRFMVSQNRFQMMLSGT